ncbi:hypothetical protein [Streptomyces sp. NPDC051738]|uniref:hypothetical protein n=1 Tax=Streptomyces sp. NPDC051738 TaxID=3365672 RepID=UPI0037D43B75
MIDDRGQVLARISKSRSPLGLRRAWRIEPTGSGNPLVGYRGTLRSWLLFIVFLPLWLPLTLVTIVVIKLDLDTGDEFTWEPPQRTVWRSRPRDLLASAALDSRLSAYRWTPTELDARIAYAQAVLHRVC